MIQSLSAPNAPAFLRPTRSADSGLRDIEVEALRRRNEALEETLRERDLLIAIVSHELRTPLTTIFGNAQMLLRRLDEMDEAARTSAISDIKEEAERLNRLVENMLQLARAGMQAPILTEPILLDHVISDVVSEHRRRFEHRSMTVTVRTKGLMAEGEPEYLRQVLQNLLSNAEKYSPCGEPIDIRAHRSGDDVLVSVLDRGAGVSSSEAEVIFQPFYRSARTCSRVPGAGIGLAVCKLLVEAQAGRIWTYPRRGGGSVFSLTLPGVA